VAASRLSFPQPLPANFQNRMESIFEDQTPDLRAVGADQQGHDVSRCDSTRAKLLVIGYMLRFVPFALRLDCALT
jgi:hypothetical protein